MKDINLSMNPECEFKPINFCSICQIQPASTMYKVLAGCYGGAAMNWQIDGKTMETVTDFTFLGSKISADGDCSHEIKRCLLLGRTAMKKPRQHIKKQRLLFTLLTNLTLLTNTHIVKAMVFPVVIMDVRVGP